MKPVLMILMLMTIVLNEQLFAQSENDCEAGNEYRYYSNGKTFLNVSGCFEIIDIGYLVVYKQPGFYKTASTNFYYFSESLQSPIYPLKLGRLRSLFNDSAIVQELKNNRHQLGEIRGNKTIVNDILNDHRVEARTIPFSKAVCLPRVQ